MPNERDVKKIYKCKLIASRPVGCLKVRWMDNVMKAIQAVKNETGNGLHRIEISGSQLLSRPKHTEL
jgi:hypothetical protein